MTSQTPPFAVDLSNDGIFLWHQAVGEKWAFVGKASLVDGNLRRELDNLKQKALAMGTDALDAVVRIPSSEVYCLTVRQNPDSDVSWENRIVTALKSASGHAMRDIAFDIERPDRTQDIQVAWVKMDVIAQAQKFVGLIGFTPIGFTTDIDAGLFPRNPDFQITAPPAPATLPPAVPQVALERPQVAPHSNTLPAGFNFTWAIGLLILALILIALIYFWPTGDTSAQMSHDKPKTALAQSTAEFSFDNQASFL